MKAIIASLALSVLLGSGAHARVSSFQRSGDPAASIYPTSKDIVNAIRDGDSCPFKSGNEVQGNIHELQGSRVNYAQGGRLAPALAPANGTD
ncbi:MAG TPA: hypothetical protein VFV50_02945 [Bdellovibrionales bacterium]|nr:hypothetical protein [Bdellovibrionales bacterium]